ncbi:hypothetical protein V865_007825 [Kwoniella europaea PYCC6329]|uniref:BZIP domain-containing protein n=1 Tax=Kwoniella europaea PYCC6329 TaxID=1423913 RepID=A0AAX4KV29_9TREE
MLHHTVFCLRHVLPHVSIYSHQEYLPTQGTSSSSTPAFTPLPTRLPPPPITTRRHNLGRATHKVSLNVQQQQQKTTTVLASSRQPSISQEHQLQVHPTEPNLALNFTTTLPHLPLLLLTKPESMEFTFDSLNVNMGSVDWDQFLVDADLGEATNVPPMFNSPAPSDCQTATPKSTESEQSAALDPETDFDFNFDFDFPLPTSVGITHQPEDIQQPPADFNFDFTAMTAAPIPAPGPDGRGTTDPTMTNTFGLSFGDFGLHTDLGADAASQLGLTNLLGKLGEQKIAQQQQPSLTSTGPGSVNDLTDAYALLDKLLPSATSTISSPTSIRPSQLSLPPSPPASTTLKRKSSESADGAQPTKKRGRPPGSGSVKSKTISLQGGGSPSSSCADESELGSPTPATIKKTISGKPSTARPKSVVPEKFLKDGSAQSILGMDINQIQSYPSFDMLLKDVAADKLHAAKEFGERIADNRDKAKDAAKKSRDERRAKIERSEYLEKKVEDLENKLSGLTGVLMSLVDRGLIGKDQIASYL